MLILVSAGYDTEKLSHACTVIILNQRSRFSYTSARPERQECSAWRTVTRLCPAMNNTHGQVLFQVSQKAGHDGRPAIPSGNSARGALGGCVAESRVPSLDRAQGEASLCQPGSWEDRIKTLKTIDLAALSVRKQGSRWKLVDEDESLWKPVSGGQRKKPTLVRNLFECEAISARS
jgi:hypothetical protein